MYFIKKTCVLRQLKQGFSGDGRFLSGLVKIEQYGKNLSIEVTVINFAPLATGEYYCLIADAKGRTEMLPLRGKHIFNLVSELEIENGFCAIVCFVKNGITAIASGVNGNASYDFRTLVHTGAEQAREDAEEASSLTDPPPETSPEPPNETRAETTNETRAYDDERVAEHDYYTERENGEYGENGQDQAAQNVRTETKTEGEAESDGADVREDDDAPRAVQTLAVDTDGYYLSVKTELDELFAKYPKDEALTGAFGDSEWVRVREDGSAEYLVGVIYEELKAKYIAYALPTAREAPPPSEIADVCVFVPSSFYPDADGFFVIFQSCTTGECIRPTCA